MEGACFQGACFQDNILVMMVFQERVRKKSIPLATPPLAPSLNVA